MDCGLRTVDYGLGIKHGLRYIKRGLQTGYKTRTGWLSWLSMGLPCGRSWVQTPTGPTLRVFK